MEGDYRSSGYWKDEMEKKDILPPLHGKLNCPNKRKFFYEDEDLSKIYPFKKTRFEYMYNKHTKKNDEDSDDEMIPTSTTRMISTDKQENVSNDGVMNKTSLRIYVMKKNFLSKI